MKQADQNNIIKMISHIELLWKRHEAAASEKARIYAKAEEARELTASGDPAADAAFDRAEAAADDAYSALEDIVDEILDTKVTSDTDIAIKARVLKRHGCVEDLGYYRPEAILEFFDELQSFAAR